MTINKWRQSPRINANRRSHEEIWIKRLDLLYRIFVIFHAMSTSSSASGPTVHHLEVILRTAGHLLPHLF